MSFKHHRGKAFCHHVEQGLWLLIALVIFGMWCFAMFKVATS